MGNLKLIRNSGKITFKKSEDNKNSAMIAGWISAKRTGIWLNHIRGLENRFFDIEERSEINENHITLYESGQIIGWIEKDYKKEIEDMLWKHLKHYTHEPVEEKEVKEEIKEEPAEFGQLALF
jgi:hypothetical protein